ncbi:MAG: RdgB/HAM1 family non-canonical purine NTP pyrophosphatase [Treponema sp.]|jgi:XTP/dITP diphosphohydrolase|nr:RdgB/HAM1 family non-canonical purine NTP pyrophosphatase [Treponema sp.]
MTLWFASGNAHKKTELAAILSGHSIKIPAEEGILDFNPPETGKTFLDNALIKAQALYRILNEPVIADDSGLSVDALEGRPGIYSSRYGADAGKPLSDSARNALLLQELADTPLRSARFICAMVVLLTEDRFFAVQETLEGEILREARGLSGFGYDPIFSIPTLGRTVAELSAAQKNRISHRGKAGNRLAALLSAGSFDAP